MNWLRWSSFFLEPFFHKWRITISRIVRRLSAATAPCITTPTLLDRLPKASASGLGTHQSKIQLRSKVGNHKTNFPNFPKVANGQPRKMSAMALYFCKRPWNRDNFWLDDPVKHFCILGSFERIFLEQPIIVYEVSCLNFENVRLYHVHYVPYYL